MAQKDDFFSQFKEIPDDKFFGALPDATPPTSTEAKKPNILNRAWNAISEPLTDAPSRFGKWAADLIDSPSLERSPTMARIEGFSAGALKGLGDVVSGFTSPINLGTTIATAGAGPALEAGLPTLAKGLTYGAKGLGALTAGHGVEEMVNPESTMSQRGLGLAELAGGVAGMRTPMARTRPLESVGESIANDTHIPASITPNESLASAPTEVAPRFNRRGETGNTGTMQAASNPDTIYLKMPTPENVKKAREAGYVFEGLDSNGRFKMRKTGEPSQMPVLESEVSDIRPTKSVVNKEGQLADIPSDGHIGTMLDTKKGSKLEEAYNFPRAVMASVDMSAPLRQGLGLIHKKEFWNSLSGMFKAWGSEDAFRAIQSNIAERPLFRPRVGKGNTILPSFAEDAGLKLGDLTNLNNREEMLMSTWAEKVPGVRRSNRAYTAFLNKLRADTFEHLVGDFNVINPAGKNDLATARSLAEFVNTATGRGSLGKLEPAAKILSGTFFSPRLIASRLNMLGQGANAAFRPSTYLSSAPNVRMEYLKSMATLFGAGNAMLQLAKAAGAEVSYDPRSSDFGKIKIGNTRIDVWGGYQQYMVLLAKMASGQAVSASNPDKVTNLGEEFGRDTRLSVLARFGEQKLHPVLNFATGWLRGKDAIGQPFNVPEEVAQRFTPIFLQDFKEMLTENPNLLPWAEDAYSEIHPENLPMLVPDLFGMGTQNFSR